MNVETVMGIVLVAVPLLLLAEGLVILLVWGNSGGGMPWLVARWHEPGRRGVGGAAVGYWLLWSSVTAILVWFAAFVAIHLLLSRYGAPAAWIGIAASLVVMAAIPVVWALVMDRRDRRAHR